MVGDQLVAIGGFPLDWRTMEQWQYGFFDVDQLKGSLPRSASLYEFATKLLNATFRDKSGSTKPTIVVARPRAKEQLRITNDQSQDMKLSSLSVLVLL